MVLKLCLCSFMGKVGHKLSICKKERAHDGSLSSLRCFSVSQSAGLRLKNLNPIYTRNLSFYTLKASFRCRFLHWQIN